MLMTNLRLPAAFALLLASALSASAVDRNVTIHNETGYTIYRFRSTNSGSSKFGSDVMGSYTLPSGSSMNLNFDNKYNYCEFDFRFEFEDGTSIDRYKIDVCTVGDYTLTP
jgi:propanediol dehydratase large subunit